MSPYHLKNHRALYYILCMLPTISVLLQACRSRVSQKLMYSITEERFLLLMLMTLMAEYELPVHRYTEHKKCHSGINMYFFVVSNRIWVWIWEGNLAFGQRGSWVLLSIRCSSERHENEKMRESMFGSERHNSAFKGFPSLFPWCPSSRIP